MKRILLTLLMLILAAAVLTSCELKPSGDTDPDDSLSFEITASSDVYYLGGESISLSLLGDAPEGYEDCDVEFYIVDDTSSIATLSADGELTLDGTGSVTLKGRFGDIESTNSVTVYSLNPNDVVAAKVADALTDNPYLGKRVDIGIDPDTVSRYSVDSGDGFVTLNSDGQLEFIGIRATQARLCVFCGQDMIYQGMYSMENSPISVAVLDSMLEYGMIPDVYTDVPNGEIAGVTLLDLSYTEINDISEYYALTYFTSLESLDLSGDPLYDLSFLSGFTTVKELTLNDCTRISNNDGGLTLYNTLESLTGLEKLSLKGSLSCFDRTTYNMLTSMVKRGEFIAELIEGVTVDSSDVYRFSETVFFSFSEYLAHADANGGVITPADGYTHAILAFAAEETDLSEWYCTVDASKLSLLQLYGAGKKYGTRIYSTADLTLDLYDYSISLSKAYNYGYMAAIEAEGLNLNVMRGSCSVTGANNVVYELDEPNVNDKGYGIYAAQSVNISVTDGAYLSVYGGCGAAGENGISDGSNPDSVGTGKSGTRGWDGIYGIRASKINFLCGRVNVFGGNGGKGGDGGDGTGVNIFNGGYNGGHGAYGGDGADAICCKSYTVADSADVSLSGGVGGNGGAGGNGYLAGKDGDPGKRGNDGWYVSYL